MRFDRESVSRTDSGNGGLFNVTGSAVNFKASFNLSEAVTLGASKEVTAKVIRVDCLSIIIKGQGAPGSLRTGISDGYSCALEFDDVIGV